MFRHKELKTYTPTADEMASYQWAKMTTAKGVMWIKLYNFYFIQLGLINF